MTSEQQETLCYVIIVLSILYLLYYCREMFEGLNGEISSQFGDLYGNNYTQGYQNQFYGSRDQSKINFSSHPSDYSASGIYKPNYCANDNFNVSNSYDIASTISPANPSSRINPRWSRPHGPSTGTYNESGGGMGGFYKFL